MKVKLWHIIAIITILISIFLFTDVFKRFDLKLQDIWLQSERTTDHRIVILAIDDQSLREIGQWPWARDVHADVLEKLTEGNAATVGFDITFPLPSKNESEDERFIKAVQEAGNVVLARYGVFDRSAQTGIIESNELSEPFPALKNVAKALGHLNTIPDTDGVVRQALYQFTYNDEIITSFSAQLAKLYGSKNGQVIEVSEEALNAHQQFHIEYAGKPGDFEILSYADVVNGTIPPAYFENRIVLIGPYTVGIKDDFLTPMDAKQSMYGVEIHANIIQNILEENYKNEIHWVMNLLIVVALAGTIYLAGRKLSPIVSFIVAIVFVILVFITSKLLYEAGWIISLIYPLLLIIAAYIATVAYNYLVELTERKRITSIFGKYVAPQVVSQILQDGEEGLKLGGSRKEVTVMFVDIRGFTPLSEGVEPEEIVGILNEYLELTSSCIFNHNGTLDKFIGDATMAMFNAPLPLENHELQAAKTALAMKEGSVELEKMLQERFGKSVKFGIGIHTGQAVVGNIGAKSRMDYTVIGDTVNTAARLESNAKPGQILLSEQVYEKIKDAIVANPLGEIMVKGKAHPIKIYELEGIV